MSLQKASDPTHSKCQSRSRIRASASTRTVSCPGPSPFRGGASPDHRGPRRLHGRERERVPINSPRADAEQQTDVSFVTPPWRKMDSKFQFRARRAAVSRLRSLYRDDRFHPSRNGPLHDHSGGHGDGPGSSAALPSCYDNSMTAAARCKGPSWKAAASDVGQVHLRYRGSNPARRGSITEKTPITQRLSRSSRTPGLRLPPARSAAPQSAARTKVKAISAGCEKEGTNAAGQRPRAQDRQRWRP
jgi:hypothetical protein